MSDQNTKMTAIDLQNTLRNLIDSLADAREEIEGDDDDISLADIARDMVDDFEGLGTARTFEDAGLLTRDAGLVIHAADGSEFQITIVRRR